MDVISSPTKKGGGGGGKGKGGFDLAYIAFQCNRSSSSAGEACLRVFTIYSHGDHLC